MFFADPVAAFTNIGRALRPGGRMVQLVWQERDRNEWATAIRHALAAESATARRPDAFSLADPTVTEEILSAAGFTEVGFTEVHEPVYYGPDADKAFDAVVGLWGFNDEQARTRLRATVDSHTTDGGVYFDSRSWIVTASRS